MGKLHDQMKMDLELKNLSRKTRDCYLARMRDFVEHYGRSPESMGDEEIRNYLYYLMKEKKVSQSVINQSYSALKFFYETTLQRAWNGLKIPRIKQRKRLPVVLTRQEVESIFSATRNLKHRAILMTIYSGGLRISEAAHLKLTDIDSKRMVILLRQGKGNKDRYTLLAKRTLEILRTYWKVYHPVDWLFPGRVPGKPINVSSIQKTFKKALKQAGIKKRATVHTLRHSFATQLLEVGTDLYYIQRLLGHTSANTTAVYLHVTGKDFARLVSPIDLWEGPQEPPL
jgi:integrase/recombinase XerD